MRKTMIISIASGKGGTGKTTISTSLARALGKQAQLLDCDVEEPNCHIFGRPEIRASEPVYLPVPKVDEETCTRCGTCGEICQFSAIVVIGKNVLTFPELCHGCGGCSLLCPEKAITEESRELGVLETGFSGDLEFVHGVIRIGEAMSPPLIKEVKAKIDPQKIAILDAPPGTSCPVITTVRDTDFVILVTEPTPFGLHDLKIAVDAVRPLDIPMGVVLNRSDIGDSEATAYCAEQNLPILMEIPHDRRIAEGYSRGITLVESAPEYTDRFLDMYREIETLASPAKGDAERAAL
jgi:MinD superfamily P-loop ATPase